VITNPSLQLKERLYSPCNDYKAVVQSKPMVMMQQENILQKQFLKIQIQKKDYKML